MKRPVIVGGVVAAIGLTSAILLGMKAKVADESPQRMITAVGTATVAAPPDSARLYLEVITTGKTITAARKENASRMQKVRTALGKLNLPDLRSKTLDVTVSPVYSKRKDEDDVQHLVGYEVTHSFTVLITETKQDRLNAAAGRVLDTALENGVNSTQSVSFFKANIVEMKHVAMGKAVEDAIANARAYAGGAKLKIGNVVFIGGDGHNSHPSHWGGQQGMVSRRGSSTIGMETSFVTGKSEVTCTVRITCRF